MKKTIKALIILFIGLFLFVGFWYAMIAFLKVETNPLLWAENTRFFLVYMCFCYIISTPFLIPMIKDEIE